MICGSLGVTAVFNIQQVDKSASIWLLYTTHGLYVNDESESSHKQTLDDVNHVHSYWTSAETPAVCIRAQRHGVLWTALKALHDISSGVSTSLWQ